ncbi:hypothetical protein PVAND_009478 [Polypedilum vanderplanki]|uniref:Bis(5'-nucleosyl)-tetraphosphatase [asymmetrical] n=1 Tax=Polypedilum vanderplanki TaxID=319348 RepID=A0A9J6CDA2_POLVA|nr:hypothetical protein PVAND_009478 [Polypedilum vanderplanki]
MAARRASGFLIYRFFSNEIQYLLLRASYAGYHWTPPKGHAHSGESDFETALRETREETGYIEKDLIIYKDISRTLNYRVKKKPKVVTYFLAQLKDPFLMPILSEEHTEFKYLTKRETILLSGYKNFGEMIEYFDKEIRKIHSNAQINL